MEKLQGQHKGSLRTPPCGLPAHHPLATMLCPVLPGVDSVLELSEGAAATVHSRPRPSGVSQCWPAARSAGLIGVLGRPFIHLLYEQGNVPGHVPQSLTVSLQPQTVPQAHDLDTFEGRSVLLSLGSGGAF